MLNVSSNQQVKPADVWSSRRLLCLCLILLPSLGLLHAAPGRSGAAPGDRAAIYYVSPDGSNSLSTSEAAPGLLSFAIANAPRGSTVVLEDGTYDGAATDGFRITQSGVIFRAQHWHKAVIKNSKGSNLWGPASHSVINDICQGIVFGPCVTPVNGGWSGGGGDGWKFQDCVFTQNDGVGFGNYSLVLHCLFTDQWFNAFDVNSVSGFTMRNSIARRSNRANADSDSVGNKCDFATNLTFDGLIAYDNAGPALWFDTRNIHWIVRNSTFFANHGGNNWFTLGIGRGISATQFTGYGQDGEGIAVGAHIMALSGTPANLRHETVVTAAGGNNPQTFTVNPPLPTTPNRDDVFAVQHPNGLATGSGLISEANYGPGLAENNVFYSNTDNGLEDNDSGSKSAITIHNNRFVANHGRGIQFRGMAITDNAGNVDRKRGAHLLSDLTKIGENGSYGSWHGNDRTVSWNDGSPTSKLASDHGYIWQNAAAGNQGWSFTAPADTQTRTVCVYAGGYSAQVTLTAHLSDASAPDYTVTQTYPNGGMTLFTLAYHAGSPGRKLTVTYIKSGIVGEQTTGSADLDAVWLTTGGEAGQGLAGTATPATASYDLSARGTLDWIHWGRVAFTSGDRLLGAALVTDNLFKGDSMAWGTVLEEHVLAKPADMGSVFDANTYDITPSYHGAWCLWKPTDAKKPVTANSLTEMRKRLGIEMHGVAKQVRFRGTLVPVTSWPSSGDTDWNDIYRPNNAYSSHSLHQVNDDETPYIQNAVSHGAPGQKVTLKVFGHTPFQGSGPFTCEVYDYSGRWMKLTLKSRADCDALDVHVPPYAVLTPEAISVTLTSADPYNLAATYSASPTK